MTSLRQTDGDTRLLRGLRAMVRTVFFLSLLNVELLACQVPVFRYALERWSADDYRVVVLHDGPLDAAAASALKTLLRAAKNDSMPLQVQVVDFSTHQGAARDPRLLDIWKPNSSEPLMLVYYPIANDVGREEPAYQAALSNRHVATLLDSPVRQEITKRLTAGDSAVWIFVPCGRDEEDAAAYARLEKQLADDAKRLELPSAEDLDVKRKVLAETRVPLRIGFSTVKLNRDDLAERFVLQSLLRSEDDLIEFDEPLAFPVFGQGRVLYCLVGEGIATDTIRSASAFMAGPCSCQVKNQNPGFDLLLSADWKKMLGDVLISEPVKGLNRFGQEPTLLTIPPGKKSQ